MERYNELRQGETGAWVSIIAYVILSAVKLIIGYVFHSEALSADGLNNTTDIIASLAVLIEICVFLKSRLMKIIHTVILERKILRLLWLPLS